MPSDRPTPGLIHPGDLVVVEALIAAGGRRVRLVEATLSVDDGPATLEVVQEDGLGPFLPVGMDVHVIPADDREPFDATLPPIAAERAHG